MLKKIARESLGADLQAKWEQKLSDYKADLQIAKEDDAVETAKLQANIDGRAW